MKVKHVALPSCIVWVIRRKYEDKDGKYSGFPPTCELLQKAVDAHNKFTDDTKVYDSTVDMANPKDGLLTSLQKLNPNTQNAMCDGVQEHGGPTWYETDNGGRWIESVDKGIQVLPRLGFLACTTAFESFIHDSIKRCLDVLFPTRKVSSSDEICWMSEFKRWSNSRANQSQFWPDEVHEYEIHFWTDFISELRTKVDHSATHSKYMLETLHCFPKKVFQQLTIDPTSQNAVGLVQEMLDAKKQEIMGKMQCPTFSFIQQTFCDIAASIEAPNHKARQRKNHEKSTTMLPERLAKKRKTQRKQDLAEAESPGADIPKPLKTHTSTQPRSTALDKKSSQTELTAVIEHAVEYLITDYANMYHWQIWQHGAAHNVKCKSSQSLKYLSNLFYGIRCIFSHGSPRKTVEFGAMGVGRRPGEACDFDIDVLCPGKTKEQRNKDKELCESYLFHIVTDAMEKVNEMHVDHDLFKTAQSFYAYVVKIIGSVAACVTYRYSDVHLKEKATHAHNQQMQEIQEKVDAAWKWANDVSQATHAGAEDMRDVQQESADRWSAASVLSNTSRLGKMDISESPPEEPSVVGA